MNIIIKASALLLAFFILTGCSEPATPEEIQTALKVCPNTKDDIGFQINRCFGLGCNPDPLTKRKLKSIVNECLDKQAEEANMDSDVNVLERQREALNQ